MREGGRHVVPCAGDDGEGGRSGIASQGGGGAAQDGPAGQVRVQGRMLWPVARISMDKLLQEQ